MSCKMDFNLEQFVQSVPTPSVAQLAPQTQGIEVAQLFADSD